MKKIFWGAFVFLALFSSDIVFSEEGHIYLLGYPRSGNHWVSFCLHDLLSSVDTFKTEAGDYKISRGHNPVRLNLGTVDQKKNYLILVLRNYRECMMRHHSNKDSRMLEFMRFEDSFFRQTRELFEVRRNNYAITLKCYDQWNPDTRFVVYYEDLMLEPEKTLKGLMKFLGQDESLVDAFMENFEEKQNISYDKYLDPQSRFSNIFHHTSLMSEEVVFQSDEFMKSHYPEYWEKYLSRFEYKK